MKELVILGTAAQVPTRDRNHNGYFLRWESEGILFDPGEGTQRQMTYAEVAASSINHIALTHFHGDHCLGLPGVVQRLSLDKTPHSVDVYFPASGEAFFQAMTHASLFQCNTGLVEHPITAEGIICENENLIIRCAALEHRTECYGYRVEEPASRTICMEKLREFGLKGPEIGELKKIGEFRCTDGRTVYLDDVSSERPGQSFAHVMDTRPCEGARKLAKGVDMLLCEATYLESEARHANEYMHMTAHQAATLALESGAKKLILTHFSQRYLHLGEHLAEAREIFKETYAAHDLERFAFPKRVRAV